MTVSVLSATGCVAMATPGVFEKVEVGKFKSRGLWHKSDGTAPVVILIPGSGANGPEEMIPAHLTVDLKPTAIFLDLAKAFVAKNYNVLLLGKPGVEFFTEFDNAKWFYNLEMFTNLRWKDMIANLEEGVSFARSQPTVDTQKIVLLGHSEGTQVIGDYLIQGAQNIHAALLLGYTGESMREIVDWQFHRRVIDSFVATDVDTNHDGIVTRAEADAHKAFDWTWKPHQTQITYAEIEKFQRDDPTVQQYVAAFETSPLYSEGVYDRSPLHPHLARVAPVLYAINGDLDVQTRPGNVTALKQACLEARKINCHSILIPGVGHGFSEPRPPRSQQLVDMTIGPVRENFITTLSTIAEKLKSQ